MTDADKPAFVAALAELASLKPGAKLTDLQFAAWWNAMRSDWTLDEFKQGCAHLSRAMEFMPSPFHFEQLRKGAEETAAEAWTRVRQRIQQVTWHENPSLSPRIDRVVNALGGYRALAMTNSSEMHFREKRFTELWEELGQADESRTALPALQQRLSGPQRAVPRVERQ